MLRLRLTLITTLLLCACGPDLKDDDEDDENAAGTGCTLDVTYSYPEGSEATLTDCADFSLETTFEFDPDEPPLLRSYELTLFNTIETDFECWINLEQIGVCGRGYYHQNADAGGTVQFATLDCSGAPNEYEDTYTASAGYVLLTQVQTDKDGLTGNFSDEPLIVDIAGDIAIIANDITVSGTFSVRQEVLGRDAEESTCLVQDSPS